MIEIKIFCPPINLYSKPWQHAFDKRYFMRQNRHDVLRLHWVHSGRPPLEFKHGEDPWLDVAGTPSWNPAFEYRIRQKEPPEIDLYDAGFKQGYAKAQEDMINLLKARQNRSEGCKSST